MKKMVLPVTQWGDCRSIAEQSLSCVEAYLTEHFGKPGTCWTTQRIDQCIWVCFTEFAGKEVDWTELLLRCA